MSMERKSEIIDFIKSNSLMTISSVSATGQPQAALVGFGETDSFQLIIGTSNVSRKYSNILKNPNVAVVIGGNGPKTVQYEGTAREISGAEADKYSEIYFTKSPSARQHNELPTERYFLIEPHWIRYTIVSSDPWDIVELKF